MHGDVATPWQLIAHPTVRPPEKYVEQRNQIGGNPCDLDGSCTPPVRAFSNLLSSSEQGCSGWTNYGAAKPGGVKYFATLVCLFGWNCWAKKQYIYNRNRDTLPRGATSDPLRLQAVVPPATTTSPPTANEAKTSCMQIWQHV